MKVTVYTPEYNENQGKVLRELCLGIPGAQIKRLDEFTVGDGHIGVVAGWYKLQYAPSMAKRPIIEHYLSLGPRHLLMVEAGLQLRATHWQVGWEGFAGNGDFRSAGMPGDRFAAMGLELKPWTDRPQGTCLVIGQLQRDCQVQHVDHHKWVRDTLMACLEKYGRHVAFRPHPLCTDPSVYGVPPELFDKNPTLEAALAGARCCVTWNSTTGVDALLAGVPVAAMDRGAFAWPMASHTVEEPLVFPDREAWAAGLGYSQWTLGEMRAGLPWAFLTR